MLPVRDKSIALTGEVFERWTASDAVKAIVAARRPGKRVPSFHSAGKM
jgi:hypothetical protein